MQYIFLTLCIIWLFSCGNSADSNKINTISVNGSKTVDIAHTEVKSQGTGNCWAYGYSGWLEALVLKASSGKRKLDISESYLTYRRFEEQLMRKPNPRSKPLTRLAASGDYYAFKRIIKKYGVMLQSDFVGRFGREIPDNIQGRAAKYLNDKLKSSSVQKMINGLDIPSDKRERYVRRLLDRAFAVNLESIKKNIIPMEKFIVDVDENNQVLTLDKVFKRWQVVYYEDESKDLLKRVKLTLNRNLPVVFNFFVDVNALDENGVFSYETLKRNGSGHQGPHSVVIEDYETSGVDPITGLYFETLEGELSQREKNLALEYGEITSIIIKNSWGVGRRATYEKDGEFGYSKISKSYLFSMIPTVSKRTGRVVGETRAIKSFLVPRR